MTEVRHFRQCLYKLFECGQYSETCQRHTSYRPLGYKQRLAVIKGVIRDHPDSGAIMTLAATLFMGLASFETGRWARRVQSLRARLI